MKKKIEDLNHNYLGLRLSDGGGMYITGFVMMYIAQIIIILIGFVAKSQAFVESVYAQYLFSFMVQIAFFSTPFLYGKVVRKPMFENSRIKRPLSRRQMFLMPALAAACILAFLPLAEGFVRLLSLAGYPASEPTPDYAWWQFLIMLVVSAILPAIGEEFLFRGAIARAFRVKSYLFAVIFSSVLFSLFHGSATQTVHQLFLGMVLAFVYFATGSLWASILLHFFNNAFALGLDYVQRTLFRGSSISGGALIAIYVVMFVVGVFAVYLILRTVLRYAREDSGEELEKPSVKKYFTDFFKAFTLSGISDNWKTINGRLGNLYGAQEEPIDRDPEDVDADIDDKMRKLLIESNRETIRRRKRIDRISVGFAFALAAVIWVVNLINKFAA